MQEAIPVAPLMGSFVSEADKMRWLCENLLDTPKGLLEQFRVSASEFVMRYWIIDSGSMQPTDGHRLGTSGGCTALVSSSRWAELCDSLEFQSKLEAHIYDSTEFRVLNEPAGVPSVIHVGYGDPQKKLEKMHALMQTSPQTLPLGRTPLCQRIREVIAEIPHGQGGARPPAYGYQHQPEDDQQSPPQDAAPPPPDTNDLAAVSPSPSTATDRLLASLASLTTLMRTLQLVLAVSTMPLASGQVEGVTVTGTSSNSGLYWAISGAILGSSVAVSISLVLCYKMFCDNQKNILAEIKNGNPRIHNADVALTKLTIVGPVVPPPPAVPPPPGPVL